MSSRRSSFSFSASTGSQRGSPLASAILPQSSFGPRGIQRCGGPRRAASPLGCARAHAHALAHAHARTRTRMLTLARMFARFCFHVSLFCPTCATGLLLTGLHPPGRTDENLCRCFGAPATHVRRPHGRVFPDHLITPVVLCVPSLLMPPSPAARCPRLPGRRASSE